MSQTQIEKDGLQDGEHWTQAKEIAEMPAWSPAVGDSILGELAIPGYEDCKLPIQFGDTILLRTAPCVDTPFRIQQMRLVRALEELQPQMGAVLRFTRQPDSPRWKKRPQDEAEPLLEQSFSVQVVPVDDEDAA